MPKVSVVIPNYNGRRLLMKHLPAVLRCLQHGDEVLVVDDASPDQSVNWLIDFYRLQRSLVLPNGEPVPPAADYDVWSGKYAQAADRVYQFYVIHQKKNQRFGATANRGVVLATGELIFLLNSDVSPEPTVLQYLLPYFPTPLASNPVFAVGCLEKELEDGRLQLGGKNTLRFQRGMFIHARATNFSSGKTAWVSGGSGLFDRAKWLELGGFDHRYAPAYWEDVDLCWQARARGWQILFEAQAIVHHHHESTNKDAFGVQQMQEMSWRNANRFTRKNAGLWQRIAYWLWRPYWWWKLRDGHRGVEV